MSKQNASPSQNSFAKSEGFRILGIGKQEAIKYFFGGNAFLAVIVIFLIVGFLAYHSWNFLPQYRDNLERYRKSGQEFTDYALQQLKAQKEFGSLATQTRAYEIEHQLGALYRAEDVHSDFKAKVLSQVIAERKEIKRAENSLARAKADKASDAEIASAEQNLKQTIETLRSSAKAIVDNLDYGDVKNKSWPTSADYLTPIRESVVEDIITGQTTEFIKSIRAEITERVTELDKSAHFQGLIAAKAAFEKPHANFNKYLDKYREIASNNKNQANTFASAEERKHATLQSAELANNEQQRKRAEIEAERVLTEAPDYAKINQPLYDSLDEHKVVQDELVKATEEGLKLVPSTDAFSGKGAIKRLNNIQKLSDSFILLIDEKRSLMETWDHNKPVTLTEAVTGFFLGTEWVSNSSWNDFYGVLPLLAGSLMVTFVAIIIAVPFSIGGAIYVNRLSSPFEQRWIKPIIEFIGAIPSIVMAFLGVVVLGSLLVEYSQSPLLSWIPGFPAEQDKTILTAGILLALMAVPTIFTLAEDALNNVPKAYREAALALGSTDIQTVLKVIIPSCSSGIIAAVLLGFGRIIGETMVVLLVMGGMIAIPHSITDPGHSMTGILAQEIGEVEQGSLHWGALFMVGLLLFIIALTLNCIAQIILKKFTKA